MCSHRVYAFNFLLNFSSQTFVDLTADTKQHTCFSERRTRAVGMILTWRHQGAGNPCNHLTWVGPSLSCAALHAQLCALGCTGCRISSAVACNRGVCRQLTLHTYNYATCVSLPLSKNTGSSPASIHSVWQYKWWIEVFSCKRIPSNSSDQNRVTPATDKVCMLCCVRSAQCCTTWGSQHLKGCTIINTVLFL